MYSRLSCVYVGDTTVLDIKPDEALQAIRCAYCKATTIADIYKRFARYLELEESRLQQMVGMVENYDLFEAACHGCGEVVGKCSHGIVLDELAHVDE